MLLTLSRRGQQTGEHSLLTKKYLPACFQDAASAVVVQPNGGCAAVLVAATGDCWKIPVRVFVVVLGWTIQVFADPSH